MDKVKLGKWDLLVTRGICCSGQSSTQWLDRIQNGWTCCPFRITTKKNLDFWTFALSCSLRLCPQPVAAFWSFLSSEPTILMRRNQKRWSKHCHVSLSLCCITVLWHLAILKQTPWGRNKTLGNLDIKQLNINSLEYLPAPPNYLNRL